jgi:hypothetical protein
LRQVGWGGGSTRHADSPQAQPRCDRCAERRTPNSWCTRTYLRLVSCRKGDVEVVNNRYPASSNPISGSSACSQGICLAILKSAISAAACIHYCRQTAGVAASLQEIMRWMNSFDASRSAFPVALKLVGQHRLHSSLAVPSGCFPSRAILLARCRHPLYWSEKVQLERARVAVISDLERLNSSITFSCSQNTAALKTARRIPSTRAICNPLSRRTLFQ